MHIFQEINSKRYLLGSVNKVVFFLNPNQMQTWTN